MNICLCPMNISYIHQGIEEYILTNISPLGHRGHHVAPRNITEDTFLRELRNISSLRSSGTEVTFIGEPREPQNKTEEHKPLRSSGNQGT
jgi:hypothetical protein